MSTPVLPKRSHNVDCNCRECVDQVSQPPRVSYTRGFEYKLKIQPPVNCTCTECLPQPVLRREHPFADAEMEFQQLIHVSKIVADEKSECSEDK